MHKIILFYLFLLPPALVFGQCDPISAFNLPDSLRSVYSKHDLFLDFRIPRLIGDTFRIKNSHLIQLIPLGDEFTTDLRDILSYISCYAGGKHRSGACLADFFVIGELRYVLQPKLSTVIVFEDNPSFACGLDRKMYGINFIDDKVISIFEMASQWLYSVSSYDSWCYLKSPFSADFMYQSLSYYQDDPDTNMEYAKVIHVNHNGEVEISD
ncbi:hypothetical protein QWY85_12780 [Neolewinella lacunae]|uniref:Uncharacterized protein n=1 Tax=Neolewinella lacunae TaxID=1517758 RepID=A0A923PND1_9BACT|nr:hypothetical protein [Neolewinella lacunae]MBC6993697.1 hypothetical protein [Neolewinella lacunae]MDN3635541.1 hypothetical protein [Neolewinella lacunae]